MGKAQEAPPPQGAGKEEGWEGTEEGKLEELGERQAGMLEGVRERKKKRKRNKSEKTDSSGIVPGAHSGYQSTIVMRFVNYKAQHKCNTSLIYGISAGICVGVRIRWQQDPLAVQPAAYSKRCILKWVLWSVVRTFLCCEFVIKPVLE